jgi:hypothetical protein
MTKSFLDSLQHVPTPSLQLWLHWQEELAFVLGRSWFSIVCAETNFGIQIMSYYHYEISLQLVKEILSALRMI